MAFASPVNIFGAVSMNSAVAITGQLSASNGIVVSGSGLSVFSFIVARLALHTEIVALCVAFFQVFVGGATIGTELISAPSLGVFAPAMYSSTALEINVATTESSSFFLLKVNSFILCLPHAFEIKLFLRFISFVFHKLWSRFRILGEFRQR